jgi:putative acetyltransferase
MLIRAEKPSDFDEIDDVVRLAFGREDEVGIVHDIRRGLGYVPELALVAADDDHIVAHIMLSYASVADHRILQLAPLAVRPEHQRLGIGDALTRDALRRADERGEPLVLVLGHAAYYPRFGFERARACGIDWPDAPDDAWMLARLSNYDPAITGTATFPATR